MIKTQSEGKLSNTWTTVNVFVILILENTHTQTHRGKPNVTPQIILSNKHRRSNDRQV